MSADCGRHRSHSTQNTARRMMIAAAGVSTGIGMALGVGVGTAAADTDDGSLPTGSTLSKPLNDLALGSSPLTDLLEQLVSKVPGVSPGPFIGSTGEGSSEHALDWNRR